MDFRRLLLVPLAAAATLSLGACATVDAAAGAAGPGEFQYARDVGSRVATRVADPKGEVTIVWRYGNQEWVNNMCGGRPGADDVFGCSMKDPNSDRCVMFLVAPKDFQDRERLAVLGHELWHCTGARHS
jgi:hypothetical protein